MSYTPTKWQDHFDDEEGKTTQIGTSMDAKNFNHMEEGIKVANEQVICFCYEYDEEGNPTYLCYEPATDVESKDYYGTDEDGEEENGEEGGDDG